MTGADVTVESLDYAELQQYKLGGTACRAFRTRSTFSPPRTCP